MNKQEDAFATDLYNMILGGLIALRSAQEIGSVTRSPGSETLFLGKWLRRAKNQKRYSKTISAEIDNFLTLYVKKGRSAGLALTFDQICQEYQTCKIRYQVFENAPKARFDTAIEMLTKQDWSISLPIEQALEADEEYQGLKDKELYVTKLDWEGAFDDQGGLTKPLSIFIISMPQSVIDCLHTHGFIMAKVTSSNDINSHIHHYKIFPENKYHGVAAIPTKYKG